MEWIVEVVVGAVVGGVKMRGGRGGVGSRLRRRRRIEVAVAARAVIGAERLGSVALVVLVERMERLSRACVARIEGRNGLAALPAASS